MKKRVVILLLVLVLMPIANAQFDIFDIRDTYDSNPEFFDLLIFFAIFSAITRIVFERRYGDDFTSTLLAGSLSFGLAAIGVYSGYLSIGLIGSRLGDIGNFLWPVLFVLALTGFYKLFKWFRIPAMLAFLLSAVLVLILFQATLPGSVFQGFERIGLSSDTLWAVLGVVLGLGLLYLLGKLAFSRKEDVLYGDTGDYSDPKRAERERRKQLKKARKEAAREAQREAARRAQEEAAAQAAGVPPPKRPGGPLQQRQIKPSLFFSPRRRFLNWRVYRQQRAAARRGEERQWLEGINKAKLERMHTPAWWSPKRYRLFRAGRHERRGFKKARNEQLRRRILEGKQQIRGIRQIKGGATLRERGRIELTAKQEQKAREEYQKAWGKKQDEARRMMNKDLAKRRKLLRKRLKKRYRGIYKE